MLQVHVLLLYQLSKQAINLKRKVNFIANYKYKLLGT